MGKNFKVVKVHIDVLEDFLNTVGVTYEGYYVYQILGCGEDLVAVILIKDW